MSMYVKHREESSRDQCFWRVCCYRHHLWEGFPFSHHQEALLTPLLMSLPLRSSSTSHWVLASDPPELQSRSQILTFVPSSHAPPLSP